MRGDRPTYRYCSEVRKPWRDIAIAVLGAAVIALAVLEMPKAVAAVVIFVVIVVCIAFLVWDFMLREYIRDVRERRTGASVEKLKVKRTRKDNVTTTEWSDGRRDVDILAQAAGESRLTGHATGRVVKPPWWKRLFN